MRTEGNATTSVLIINGSGFHVIIVAHMFSEVLIVPAPITYLNTSKRMKTQSILTGVEHERAQWYYVMVGWCVVLLPLCAFSSNLSLSCICRSIDISIPGNIDIHHPVLSVVPKAMSVLHLFVRSCWLMPIFAGYRYAFICTCILRTEFGLRSL